ncbi:putative Late nodulin [Medicago truncatula]|uniref:Nodule Cysteine-Rich (NCR) secreted peptide n=2 Tax=Medicago truncatula TaxID=3880 RepID=G7KV51_MEDTR|nr:Nodule Cysteine-Rich (NCR) secreted peptide [Medicago truncatula]RHN46614.1 putative Late nodulin [Medicago truncatula]
MQKRRNMAAILKFVYIMIIYLFVLLVAVKAFEECKEDADCHPVCSVPGCSNICTLPDVPTCIDNNCFCI